MSTDTTTVTAEPVDERLSTVRETAERFRVSVGTIRRWVDEGKLEALTVGRTMRIYTRSADKLFGR